MKLWKVLFVTTSTKSYIFSQTFRMTRLTLLVFIFLFSLISCVEKKYNTEKKTTIPITEKIGQMIMVGFRGTEVGKNDPIYEMIANYNIGGVVLYSRDSVSYTHLTLPTTPYV